MWRYAALLVVSGIGFLSLWGQVINTSKCLPHGEYAPVLVENPRRVVTFKCDHATPLDLIHAVGFQTRTPIGIAVGGDPDALSKDTHSYDLEDADVRSALMKAIEGTGYSVREEDQVMVLLAGDLSSRQKELLDHVYPVAFRSVEKDTMIGFGMELTRRLQAVTHPQDGYAGSVSTSTNEERFVFDIPAGATTEEIANRIVSQGSKGIWVLRVSPHPAADKTDPSDQVVIEPYQHYSNRAFLSPSGP